MDYAFDPAERRLQDWVGRLAQEHLAGRTAPANGLECMFDPKLDAALASPDLAEAPLLHRLIVVEEAAALGLPALPGPRLSVGAEVLGRLPEVPVAVAERGRNQPVRLPPGDALLLSFEGPNAWMAEVDGSRTVAVPSSFGYPYAEVPACSGAPLPAGAGVQLRARRHLCVAAEIAGTARAALGLTADYLRGRQQFGRNLSAFQALRHRMAELAVSVEAATWLAREAAWQGGTDGADTAAFYARDLAARMAPEVVQLCGARSFTAEFPLHLFAMRLEGLRLVLGSADRLARALWADEPAPAAT